VLACIGDKELDLVEIICTGPASVACALGHRVACRNRPHPVQVMSVDRTGGKVRSTHGDQP